MESLTLSSRVSIAAKALMGLFSQNSATQAHGLLGGILPGSVGEPPYRGTKSILDAYSTMPWLRAVSQRVATAVATSSTQWRLYAPTSRQTNNLSRIQRAGDSTLRKNLIRESGQLREVPDHILLSALNRANSYMTGSSLFKLTQIHLDLIGESFWIKERNNFGAPVEFWPIPPDWIESTPTPSSRTYKVSFRGWQGDIPDTEILWMCDLNPSNPYGRGSGLARSLSDELETDEYAAKHTRQLFFNRARPDMIIWPKQQGAHDIGLQQDQVRRLEERWLDGHQGFWRAFKPFFVGREIEVHEVNQSLQELQLVELRKHERDIIVQVFGVPPELLGILSNSNRSTIESADYLFSRWVVAPRMEFLRAQLQERLIPEYDDRLILDFVSPVKEDQDRLLESAKAAPWAMTVNEWRNLQGQEPLIGTDGNVHMMPLNLVPVPTPSVPPVSPNVVPAGETLELDIAPSVEKLLPAQSIEVKVNENPVLDDLEIMKDAGDKDGVDFILRELADDVDDLPELWQELSKDEPKLVRMTVRLFNDLRERASDDDMIFMQSVPDFERIVQYQDWIDEFNEKWREPHIKAFRIGAELGAKDVDVDIVERQASTIIKQDGTDGEIPFADSVPWNVVNPLAVEWVATQGAELVQEIGKTTKKGIKAAITKGLEEGLDYRKVARDVLKLKIGLTEHQEGEVSRYLLKTRKDNPTWSDERVLAKVDRYRNAKIRVRSKVIARTEIAHAAGNGKTAVWNQLAKDGLINPSTMEKEWLGLSDGRECGICAGLSSGKNVPFNVAFSFGGESFMQEPAHPNCRCVTTVITRKKKP